VPQLARGALAALATLPAMPTLFFGHSMGSMVAFEAAAQLAATGLPHPRHLFVSARQPPHLRETLPSISHLPDGAFLHELNQRYAAVPAALLQYPDVLALLVPPLRADIAALEAYQGSPAAALACPITAFGGLDDPTTSSQHLHAWRELTTASFRMKLFDGGHFYLDTQRAEVLGEIVGTLEMMTVSDVAENCL